MSTVFSALKFARCFNRVCRAPWHIPLMCLLFAACQPDAFNSAEDLKQFISEPSNNLVKKVVLNGIVVEVSFKPNDLLIHQEIGGGPTDHQRLVNLERKYEENYYFLIRLIKNDSTAQEDSVTRQPQFADVYGSIYRSLSVITPEEDTIRSDQFTIEHINVANESAPEIMIVLSKKKSTYRDWIQFNLDEFGLGIGDHEFKFFINDLEHVPKLKFDVIS